MTRRFGFYSLPRRACVGFSAALLLANALNGTAAEETVRPATGTNAGKLIVHEWGTFTSFSGSNGVQLDFRPLVNEDLPNFVFDRQMQAGVPNFSKGHYRARIRMETPVTYFYTDRERTVTAQVAFPNGLLTEFYPPVKAMSPLWNEVKAGQALAGTSKLDWGEIQLIPSANLAPTVKDERTKSWLLGLIEKRILPTDGSASNHYYYARETDSAFVHVRRATPPNNPKAKPVDYLEKFLFYRGIGRFDQPLQATVAEQGRVSVRNTGTEPIRSLFQVTVSGPVIAYSELDQALAGATVEFPVTQKQTTLQELQDRVVAALVRERLYPREATAMVKTWADSWFAEEGTRVFYIVPRDTTDKVLPLTISPAPDESVRVLVGRIEVMPPSMEKSLTEVVRVRAVERAKLQKKQSEKGVNTPVQLAIPSALKKLGRLAEPALVRIRELARDDTVSNEATLLLHECQAALDKTANENKSVSVNN